MSGGMCWFQSELDVLLHDSARSSSPLSADMKQTFDRWYSDQMTSASCRNSDDSNDVDRRSRDRTTSRRLSNGHAPAPRHARTWFDPVTEIPRLQRWLRSNSHPSRVDMARYVRELNAGPHRQTLRRPLDVSNVAYWFKNARARAAAAAAGSTREASALNVVDQRSGRVPDLPNSNAVYVVSPLLAPPRRGHVTDDVTADDVSEPRRKRRRLRSMEPDENHNERRCASSLSSLSSSSSSSSLVASGCDDDEAAARQDDATATDLSVRRSRSSSPPRRPKTEQDEGGPGDVGGGPGQLHPALASTNTAVTAAPQLSLSLHVQQALQHQMQLAMRYMQHPLYPAAATPAAAAQRWLAPWLPAADPLHDDTDSSTACSTTSAGGTALAVGACDTPAGELQRRKRSRVFIDPLSEIPRLEQWFAVDSHPSSTAIERLTDELNQCAYRQRFPPLEPKNVQLWFKNHRAKVKRQSLEPLATVTSQLMNGDDVTDDHDVKPLPSNHYFAPSDVATRDEVVS